MQTKNNGGDVLARGGVRAQFPPAGGEVTQEKWNDIFADFDPEAYKNGTNSEQRADSNSDTNLPPAGDAGTDVGAAEREPITR